MTSKRLYIQTIGCQMNVYDSERISAMLRPLGYRPTPTLSAADLVIVNTCTIRQKAEQKAFSFLGRLSSLKERNPDLLVAVGGCLAQQEGKAILKRVPFVDVVFGTQAVEHLPNLIAQAASRRCRIVDVAMCETAETYEPPPHELATDAVSRFVTIMQGCDNFCSYCVVPHVRGRERSRAPNEICNEITELVRNGTREVTLLGQNVNSYGLKEGLCPFPDLLAQVNEIPDLKRLRFTTSHPKDLSDALIHAFGTLEKLCHHIHLPVQSGSDRVLRRMNRKYTTAAYRRQIDALRKVCPDIAITSDIIVGFPGESDTDFRQTLDLIQAVGYDGLFAFVYSDRPSAPAVHFSGKLPEAVKRERLQAVLDLQERHTLAKNRMLVGTTQPILVDGTSKQQKEHTAPAAEIQLSGRTTHNKIVNFIHDTGRNGNDLIGRTIPVRIEAAFCHSLRGRRMDADIPLKKGGTCHAA